MMQSGDAPAPAPLIARRAGPLRGEARVAADKSISHRAVILGAVAVGETRIDNLLEAADVLATVDAVRQLGADVEQGNDGAWRIRGVGVGGLCEPADVLDLGNSGTGARLLAGLIAGHPITAFLSGDASLKRRPMGRVIEPLRRMGARFETRAGARLPMAVLGASDAMPIEYELPVASAQVKSAVLLAGLSAPGITAIVEPRPSRDHTERMLRHFGAETQSIELKSGARRVTVVGQPELSGTRVRVPADPSAAAFAVVAGLLTPGTMISIPGVARNPSRIGLFDTLAEMGAQIEWRDARHQDCEPVADLLVEASSLTGVDVPAERSPTMIDEYPVLAAAAACATGPTIMRGIGELRVKESDRLSAMARGLAACGVEAEETEDVLVIHGAGRPPRGGATIAAEMDHRIAMSFLVLGMVAEQPVTIDDGAAIATSFPDFAAHMGALGADIAAA